MKIYAIESKQLLKQQLRWMQELLVFGVI